MFISHLIHKAEISLKIYVFLSPSSWPNLYWHFGTYTMLSYLLIHSWVFNEWKVTRMMKGVWDKFVSEKSKPVKFYWWAELFFTNFGRSFKFIIQALEYRDYFVKACPFKPLRPFHKLFSLVFIWEDLEKAIDRCTTYCSWNSVAHRLCMSSAGCFQPCQCSLTASSSWICLTYGYDIHSSMNWCYLFNTIV